MPTHRSGIKVLGDAVYALLNVAGFTALSTGGVYNDVPQGTALPYTMFGNFIETRWDSMGQPGKQITFDVHVVSQFEGDKEATEIASKAIELLHYQRPTVSGHTCVVIQYEQTVMFEELVNGILTRHHVAMFRALLDQTL